MGNTSHEWIYNEYFQLYNFCIRKEKEKEREKIEWRQSRTEKRNVSNRNSLFISTYLASRGDLYDKRVVE